MTTSRSVSATESLVMETGLLSVIDDGSSRTVGSQTSVILALDLGSSSIRCSAYQILEGVADRTAVEPISGCSSVQHASAISPTGSGKIMLMTTSGESILDVIDKMIDQTLSLLRKVPFMYSFRVVGLGFASFVMNLVAVDEMGDVCPEATMSYACNSPDVIEQCEALKRELGAEKLRELHQRTGAPLHSSYALPQLRAFYANPDTRELRERIIIWQTLPSLCLARWRGTPFSHISYSEASWTGLFNFRSCEWDKPALSLLPSECQYHLPPLADYSDNLIPSGGIAEIVGEIEPDKNPYWDRWPELRGSSDDHSPACRLFLGIGDGAAANVGSKSTDSSRIAVTIGTSAAARVVLELPMTSVDGSTDAFVVPEGLFCYRIDKLRVVLGGALTDGGSVVDWARKLLNLKEEQEFQDCLHGAGLLLGKDYDSSGDEAGNTSTVAPFLSGERSTGYRSGANFCIMGFSRESTPAHFLKACLEGVILRLETVLRVIRNEIQDRNHQILIASGAAMERNALWRQMLADCTGMEVHLESNVTEGTSRGIARLLACSLANTRRLPPEELWAPKKSHPRLNATEGYWLVALEAQENLIDAVSPLW